MADLTHADLMQMTERLEDSFRREVDRVSTQVERIGARAEDDRVVIAKHSEDIRLLQHDVRNHIDAHLKSRALPSDPMMATIRPDDDGAQRMGKTLVGAAVFIGMMLVGAAKGAYDLFEWVTAALKAAKP